MPKEPQSYGSQGDWVSGNVGEEVSRQRSGPDPQHAEACDTFDNGNEGAKKVTDIEGGARRDSFFKERDYTR